MKPTYTPTLKEVADLAKTGDGNLIPIYREINADLETPVSAYLKVARGPFSFLLESVEGGERMARYSFLGTDPYAVFKSGMNEALGSVDPLVSIENELGKYKVLPVDGLPRFNGGAVGYIAYDAIHYFEPRVPRPPEDSLKLPESIFLLANTLLVFDHLKHKILVVSHAHLEGNVAQAYERATQRIDEMVKRLQQPLQATPQDLHTANVTAIDTEEKFKSNMAKSQYHQNVRRIRDYIIKGDAIQVVLSQRLARPTNAQPFDIYRALRTVNPSPYMYYLDLDGFQIIVASPEMLVRVDQGEIAVHPIAGTRPRATEMEKDLALEDELRNDEKERAEHIMLVDLGRNDVGRVSETGTVEVTQLMDVERYSHVMHLVSHVRGQLRSDYSCFDALRSCFPAGTVSGAPKIRAMEIISELEAQSRGPYAGAVGYFSFSGNMDTAIAIRTMILKDGVAYVQAGGGIVYDSNEEMEFQETLHKASAVLRAIEEAELRTRQP